jgi:predicted CXXCH cytochrome family protein
LLTKPQGKLCWDCHDDLEKQMKEAKYTHQPAADGDCNSCHSPHAVDNAALLLKPIPAMCYECHEKADLEKIAAHKNAWETQCIQCHDPHLGKDANLLKAAAAQAPVAQKPPSGGEAESPK